MTKQIFFNPHISLKYLNFLWFFENFFCFEIGLGNWLTLWMAVYVSIKTWFHHIAPTAQIAEYKRQEDCRSARCGWLQRNSVFQIQQDWCTYELTETVTAHTGPTQVQARWGLKTEGGKGPGVSPLTNTLSAINSCWQRGNQCSPMESQLGIWTRLMYS